MADGLAIIGNCTYSALLDRGAVAWMCWPRFDSSFVFGPLLDRERGGCFAIEGVDATHVEQAYIVNTNVLRTTFRGPRGSFELIDFAPRFPQFDRWYRPTMLLRILRRLDGEPSVRVRCHPVGDYGRVRAEPYMASNHIEFTGLPAPVRLTTNVPLTYVLEERPFLLGRDRHLALTWGEPLQASLEESAESFLLRTLEHWRSWVKDGRIPRDYQQPVIRSALVLKLHQFQDTGALIAATTTSLPEHPGSGRNWDYRYCWLRDAYFTLNALERIGHVDEMERFLLYLRNLCERSGGHLQPLYGIGGERELPEQELEHLAGYAGERPVRIGNQAWQHVQNDVYGEMVLAVGRLLLDSRFVGTEGVDGALRLVENLVERIEQTLEDPDAGLWELRGSRHLHSFTLLMHWAGSRRAAEIGEALGAPGLSQRASALAERSRSLLEKRCWDPRLGAFTQAAGKKDLDAAMLLAVQFGLLPPDDPRAATHVEAIRRALSIDGGLLKRYDSADDFGRPQAAFTVCSFWLAEALAAVGKLGEARELFERLLTLHNGLGLYSEDILATGGRQSGNFPQTYSHVGLINAAFRLSRPWT
jgi:GH15 family glucan-1,4-alpha-glucosidase